MFSFGFFIESIVGFGGTLVTFAILGFFYDIKELILIGLYLGTVSSIFIFASDYKIFKKEIFLKSLPFCLAGTILGVLLFINISSPILLKLFGAFLIILSIKTFFFDKIKFPRFLVRKFLVIGGICHGIFGIGGPFFATILKNQFISKSALRTTMAVFFITFNIVRYIQLTATGDFNYNLFFDFWWMPMPLAFAIYYGHKVHIKISEQFSKNAIASLTLFSGLSFFF